MRKKKLTDLQRIREIIGILIEPYQDLEHLSVEVKLHYTIQPHNYPIYRRKINKSIKVYGLWWMDEEQYCQYLWNGHKGSVIKTDQDPDRVLATRSFMANGWCYVREKPDGTYDLEAMSYTKEYDEVKHKSKTVADWMTVSITKNEYEGLDKYLGPIQDEANFCKHTYEGMMG